MPAPPQLKNLVEHFRRNLDSYRSGNYKETELRREFVDPFFKMLGWDIDNSQHAIEDFKEVVHEFPVRTAGTVESVDYCFRIGRTPVFLVEAKKPSVNLKTDVSAAYQARRYAWNMRLPVCVLTDFEEFVVYDCRFKPSRSDKTSHARPMYATFEEYATRWDEIAALFSREAVVKGSIPAFVEAAKTRRGTASVDEEFLREIEAWRDKLARNIALRNRRLTQRELNYAVQATIDRIIFLRMCEDRGIEPYGILGGAAKNDSVHKNLIGLFEKADQRYNSGLFHFHPEKDRPDPDTITPRLKIDDEPLRGIVEGLYPPESDYEFSLLPVEILGHVYEKFLGKVIRLTAGHAAKVEEKPEVKKAGGVYYTPSYIVDYIVKNTVGKLLEGKTPRQVEGLSVLDPACGSGSFLIAAYQVLLDWHLEWYTRNGPEGRKNEVHRIADGRWRLTTRERKRVLLNAIFGVDIDPQAVEVTKLSLLLKVLEGESDESLTNQMRLFHERALPDLSNNIKCGNSLIERESLQLGLFDEDTQYRINAFDWKAEFPAVMKAGGFDAVIGNPPYIRIQAMQEWAPVEVEHYKGAYAAAAKGNYDIYVVFIEKGLSLLNPRGRLGYICPHKFFNAQYGESLRGLLAKGRHLSQVIHFGDQQVFEEATTYTCLLFLDKKGGAECRVTRVTDLEGWRTGNPSPEGAIPAARITSAEWNFAVGKGAELFEKLQKMPVRLGDISSIFVGLQTSADTVFLFKDCRKSAGPITRVQSKELGKAVDLESALLKSVVRSGEIGRYWASPTALVLFPYRFKDGKCELIPEAEMKSRFRKAWAYLHANKALLSGREHGKFARKGWYQLYPKNLELWEQPKVMLPYMITRLSAYYDEEDAYFVNVTTGGFGITLDRQVASMKYLTGLLSSRLLDWCMRKVSSSFHGGYFAANKQFLVQLPIRPINFSDVADKARHDRMVGLVEQMLALHKRIATLKSPHEQTALQRHIDATDREIDRLVYEMYALTDAEIAIIEGKSE